MILAPSDFQVIALDHLAQNCVVKVKVYLFVKVKP